MSSLPSVPSLPSISRTGLTGTGSRPGTGSFGTSPGSRPGFTGTGAGTNPGAAVIEDRSAMVQPKSGMIVYVLVGVLLLAIAVLAFLLFAK
jgi:cobalamin biosynthesis Mg chelatase CobN